MYLSYTRIHNQPHTPQNLPSHMPYTIFYQQDKISIV